jgi:hypothetical protein
LDYYRQAASAVRSRDNSKVTYLSTGSISSNPRVRDMLKRLKEEENADQALLNNYPSVDLNVGDQLQGKIE